MLIPQQSDRKIKVEKFFRFFLNPGITDMKSFLIMTKYLKKTVLIGFGLGRDFGYHVS